MGKKPRAVLLLHDEIRDEDGWLIGIKVWKVPVSKYSPDGVDYSLALISPHGERMVGYDNHWPKGHHRHFQGEEQSYVYRGVDQLVTDFRTDMARLRRETL